MDREQKEDLTAVFLALKHRGLSPFGAIYMLTGISGPRVLRSLKMLEDAGLVECVVTSGAKEYRIVGQGV